MGACPLRVPPINYRNAYGADLGEVFGFRATPSVTAAADMGEREYCKCAENRQEGMRMGCPLGFEHGGIPTRFLRAFAGGP